MENWVPNKSYAQLLKIQHIIDEYFIFKTSFRPTRTVELQELIRFVRDIQGYYFDKSRFDKLTEFNPNLYRLIRLNGVSLVKCPAFKQEQMDDRARRTKVAMIRYCRRESMEGCSMGNGNV